MSTTMRGVLIAAVIAVGCGDDDAPMDGGGDAVADGASDAPEPTAPIAVFEVPETGAVPYGAAPFPHEVFRGADGTLDLGSAPGATPLWQGILEKVNERNGFCRSCPIVFPIDGEIDPASVPADSLEPGAPTDAVLLKRLGGGEGFLPLEIDATDGFVSIRPGGLRVLDPATTYVAALTDALSGPGGLPLTGSEQFLAIRDGEDTTSRAASVVNRALDVLRNAGVDRERIVSVTIFRTVDTIDYHRSLAPVVEGAAPPTATVDRIYLRSDGTLDELMGTPAMDAFGFVEAAAGTEGDTALAHGSVEAVILGSFDAPRIVEGTGTEIGFLRRNAEGDLEAGPTEAVPFALVIPTGADLTALPVAVSAAGLPGTRALALLTAETFAEMGVATISIDPYQNGARAASAEDVTHEARGLDGPDGLSENGDNVEVVTTVQGGVGHGDEPAFHPGFSVAATAQMISDLAMLQRFLEEGDLAAIAAADASLSGLAFDADHLYFYGLSAGAATGINALVLRPGYEAAILQVAYGTADLAGCQGPGNRMFIETLATIFLGVRAVYDEVDRHLCLDPSVAFITMVIEDVFPSNVIEYLLETPLHDQPPHLLLQQAGHDENIGLATGEAFLVASGAPVGGDDVFEFTSLTTEAGPFADNRETPYGTVTVGGWMYGGAEHEMVAYRETEQNWEAPLRAPFTAIDPPATITNPTDAVHRQMQAFIQSHLDGGPVTITAP